MSKVDWSLAPEGYPLWLEDNYPGTGGDMSGWHRDDGDRYTDEDGLHWFKHDSGDYVVHARPKQPQAWSGPEDGLPPVGMVCEFAGGEHCAYDPFDKDLKEGARVTIIAHFKSGGFDIAAFTFRPMNANRGEFSVEQGMHGCFRPIKTPERIAADTRESAIRDVMDIAQVDCRVTAARLVDAGFKR